ncbi:MAG: pilus assembly protein TadG-related protein [Proteobacteria bacterium]|nr:pilus assembly protein TadG-related protein [Pseudomonadota bacterium]
MRDLGAKRFGILGRLASFLKCKAGNISIIAGFSAVPIFAAVGVAVDSARINHEQTMFHAAVDSAVLAIAADDRSSISGLSGTSLTSRMTTLKQMAKSYIKTNYESSDAASGDLTVNLTITGQQVTLSADLEFPTSIMSLFGVDSIEYTALSQVQKAMRPIELVMVMDTTGSMNDSSKLAGAKAAAQKLLTTLYGGSLASAPSSEYIRVSLVPFSGAVHLNTSAYDFNLNWIDTTGTNSYSKLNFDASLSPPSTWNNYTAWAQTKKSSSAYNTWNGCVETRQNGSTASGTDYNINDVAPSSSTPATRFPAYFNPDIYGSSVAENSYGISYLGGTSTSTVGSECRGLTSTVCSSTTTANLLQKQENYYKYVDANVGTESANPSSTTSSYYGPWGGCAVSKVVPMTYDRSKVETGITDMRAHGITIIPEGLAWGWRVISPTEPFTKVEGFGSLPNTTLAPYNDAKWQKIMVLMTDGDNNVNGGSYTMNVSRYSSYGLGSESLSSNRFGTTSSSGLDTALDNYTKSLCTKIKTSGVTMYVASFGSDLTSATKTMLQNCATGTEYYKHASTSADLQAFFDHIGEDVINKSIYVSR